ncbi:MAG: kynurenine 3-monooxygenase [Gammaproteobacteria bacterium]|nr:MAG: kynurenine 3-monooxygenase [Gammaproteobacteria bacterium]
MTIKASITKYSTTKESNKETITIAGAGPVGALLAVILARAGYSVNLFESRSDSRLHSVYQGKSINIALSDRGWLALESVGISEKIKTNAIAMKKRVIHAIDGSLTEQAYGKEGQAIWSVSRSGVNEELLSLAEAEPIVKIFFEQRLSQVNFDNAAATFTHEKHNNEVSADYLFGADGAYSKVRRLAQETPRFSYSQSYMPQCYIELNIAANEKKTGDARFKMKKEALHIWPRKDFMLIALPNPDGTFTCTLFLNFECSDQSKISFSALKNKADITEFFHHNFADAMTLLENPIDDFMQKPANPLFLVNVDPWVVNNKVALIGDAAHAMVPFYGQGMNCGFEDCRELGELIATHQGDWTQIFPAYQTSRQKNADAITELAKRNFIEMSELSGNASFLLQKKIEAKFHDLYPKLWTPLYSMVTFSPHLPYANALEIGEQQQKIMQELMADLMQVSNIEQCWQEDFVYQKMHDLVIAKPLVYNQETKQKRNL